MDAVQAARNGRSELDILARSGIPLVLGSQEWKVRPRSIKSNRQWQSAVKEKLGAKFASLEGLDGLDEFYAYLSGSGEVLLDLVLAYDETSQLPERDWIEDNASEHEVLEAFMVLLEQAFPFFAVGRRFLPPEMGSIIMGRLIAAVLTSASPPSMNGPSQAGVSAPRRRSRKA